MATIDEEDITVLRGSDSIVECVKIDRELINESHTSQCYVGRPPCSAYESVKIF